MHECNVHDCSNTPLARHAFCSVLFLLYFALKLLTVAPMCFLFAAEPEEKVERPPRPPAAVPVKTTRLSRRRARITEEDSPPTETSQSATKCRFAFSRSDLLFEDEPSGSVSCPALLGGCQHHVHDTTPIKTCLSQLRGTILLETGFFCLTGKKTILMHFLIFCNIHVVELLIFF